LADPTAFAAVEADVVVEEVVEEVKAASSSDESSDGDFGMDLFG